MPRTRWRVPELYDYVDDHFYVDHPDIEQPWQLPSTCANVNPIRNDALGAQNVVAARLLEPAFTITEYRYSGPGRFRGTWRHPHRRAGVLQGWSGIWRFTYSHERGEPRATGQLRHELFRHGFRPVVAGRRARRALPFPAPRPRSALAHLFAADSKGWRAPDVR